MDEEGCAAGGAGDSDRWRNPTFCVRRLSGFFRRSRRGARRCSSGSALSRRYRTDLQEACDTGPVNFAGHYVLTSIGCGAGCVQVAAIDAGAGSVTWLTQTVCCWPLAMTEPLEYRRDSRLLIVHGALNEKGSGVHAFVFDGRRFVAKSP